VWYQRPSEADGCVWIDTQGAKSGCVWYQRPSEADGSVWMDTQKGTSEFHSRMDGNFDEANATNIGHDCGR
jgi:hypothetical protein